MSRPKIKEACCMSNVVELPVARCQRTRQGSIDAHRQPAPGYGFNHHMDMFKTAAKLTHRI